MPDVKEPRFFAPELLSRFRDQRGRLPPRGADAVRAPILARRLSRPVRRPPTRDALAGEGFTGLPAVGHGGAAHRRGSTARAHHRHPSRARPRSCARCTSRTCTTRDGGREGLRQGSLGARGLATRGDEHPSQLPLAAGAHVFRARAPTSSSCADSGRYSRRRNMLVLVYDDFRRDNDATARREVLRFLDLDDSAPLAAIETNPLKPVRSQHLHSLRRKLWKGRHTPAAGGRTFSRAAAALIPEAGLRSGSGRRLLEPPSCTATPAPPDEALMLEIRRPLQGRGGRAERVPGPRSRGPVGL